MSAAAVILFNRYVLSGNSEFGKGLKDAIEAAPIHGGRQYVEMIVDGLTGKFLEVLRHDPSRIYGEALQQARKSTVHGPQATIATLIFDATSKSLLDVALADQVASVAYNALSALPETFDSRNTRFAA